MKITWKVRMEAPQQEVWTGAQLRRLLADKAGLELSSASVSALLTKEPNQIKLSTLVASCTALQCCAATARGVCAADAGNATRTDPTSAATA